MAGSQDPAGGGETCHLTMGMLLWAAINGGVAFHVRNNPTLLWVVSLVILLQYLTDLLDGEVGREH